MKSRRLAATVLVAVAVAGTLATASAAASGAPAQDRTVRVDQIQVLGTHNSYHLRPDRAMNPDDASNYAHPPLDQQLASGIRSLEIDIQSSPDFPVYHSIIVDPLSNCADLRACLDTIATWSAANPDHVPITVFLELKEIPTNSNPTLQAVITQYVADHQMTVWDAAALDRIDGVVRQSLGDQLLTPDQVRGAARTLKGALARNGWPTLAKTRGKVMVILNSELRHQLYLEGAPSLQHRAMFVIATNAAAPSAAFVSVAEPDAARVRTLLAQHMMVRTEADANGVEARANDLTRATAAFASGAQVVATDYDVADPTVGPYVVSLPGGAIARCDPVNAPRRCNSAALEPR